MLPDMKQGTWRTTWLIQGCMLGVLLGLVNARYQVVEVSLYNYLCLGVLTLPFLIKGKILAIIPCVCLGLVLGQYRGAEFAQTLLVYDTYQDQKVQLSGSIQTDPVYTDTGQTEFYITNPMFFEEVHRSPGRVRVRTFNATVQRGDTVTVSGTLRDGFASWQGAVYYAQTDVENKGSGFIHNFRQNFIASIYSVLPDPEASLGLGFLIGVRSLLPESLETDLSRTGLTHIVAVSGYNLTILVLCMRRICMRYFSRYAALLSSLILLATFLLITGSSPSIVRASVVSVLSLIAWYFGRSFHAVMILLISGVVTAWANPLYVWGDIGWYLSFLAFFGVLVLAPLVTKLIYTKKQPGILGQILIESTMAQIMTMPLILLIFKEVSLIALLANVIVLPLIPLAMLGTFLSGIFGMMGGILAYLVVMPTQYILTFITNSITLLAAQSWSLQKVALSTYQFVVYMVLLMGLWFLLHTIAKRKQASVKESDILIPEME